MPSKTRTPTRVTESGVSSLRDVPAHQRQGVLSGMRWTLWLSMVAVPFSFAINMLLARVGPETIGAYGVWSLYIGMITAFCYFGGETVVIRYVPECKREDRVPFLCSYLLLILAVNAVWLIIAYFWPHGVGLILGRSNGVRFNIVALAVAPIAICFAMVGASLKGMLEIAYSQVLTKLLTIGSLIIYAIIFVTVRSMLADDPTEVIWSVCLGLMATLGAAGALRIVRLSGKPHVRFYLPNGFWRYALTTQIVGVVFFLSYRLDYMLILHFGGLAVLGRYVAVMSVAAIVPMSSAFFMDTLLPSLTNMLASGNHKGAAQLFMIHMRILFLATTGFSLAIMALALPATELMGTKYTSIHALIIFMVLVQGIAVPGSVGGTLLASAGRLQHAVWAGVLHSCLLCALFFAMWPRWHLGGAVAAYGLTVVLSSVALMAIALRNTAIYPSIARLWLRAAAVEALCCLATFWWPPLSLVRAAAFWFGGMALFLPLAGYSVAECRELVQTFMPLHATPSGSDRQHLVEELVERSRASG